MTHFLCSGCSGISLAQAVEQLPVPCQEELGNSRAASSMCKPNWILTCFQNQWTLIVTWWSTGDRLANHARTLPPSMGVLYFSILILHGIKPWKREPRVALPVALPWSSKHMDLPVNSAPSFSSPLHETERSGLKFPGRSGLLVGLCCCSSSLDSYLFLVSTVRLLKATLSLSPLGSHHKFLVTFGNFSSLIW